MRKLLLLGAAVLPIIATASKASAVLAYDNTGFANALFTSGIASIFFDDATLVTPTNSYINQFDIGYQNMSANTSNFDLLVQFYNNVNYGAAYQAPVGTNPIGSLIDITGLSVAGSNIDETGLRTLTGSLPVENSGTVGFEFEFVKPGTTAFSEANIDSDLTPIFRDPPATIGSSNNDFAYDKLNQNNIVGDAANGDVYTFADPGNVYASIGAVPEPGSMTLLGIGAAALLGRRKRVKQAAASV